MADLTTYLTHIILDALEALLGKSFKGTNFSQTNNHVKNIKLNATICIKLYARHRDIFDF